MYNNINTYYICIRQNNNEPFICKEFDTPEVAQIYTLDSLSNKRYNIEYQSMLIPVCKFTPHFIRKFLIDNSLAKTFIKSKIE